MGSFFACAASYILCRPGKKTKTEALHSTGASVRLGTHLYMMAVHGWTMCTTQPCALGVYTVTNSTPCIIAIQGCSRPGKSTITKKRTWNKRKMSLFFSIFLCRKNTRGGCSPRETQIGLGPRGPCRNKIRRATVCSLTHVGVAWTTCACNNVNPIAQREAQRSLRRSAVVVCLLQPQRRKR